MSGSHPSNTYGVLSIPDHLGALAQLAKSLDGEHIDYWLFGGWAVDFHAGRVTREHGDIDIAVWLRDRARIAALLQDSGWTHRPESDGDGYTCYEGDAVQLEIAFLVRDERGHVYTPLMEGRADWPADSFGSDVLELRDVTSRVISRAALIAEKTVVRSDAPSAAKDRADIASLLHAAGHSQPPPAER